MASGVVPFLFNGINCILVSKVINEIITNHKLSFRFTRSKIC
jgi:hypothetical protein